MEIMSIGIFLSPRGITLPKIIDWTQIRTQPAYSRDKPMYQISYENLHTCMKEKMSWNWLRNDRRTEMGIMICPGHFISGGIKKLIKCNNFQNRKIWLS